MMDKYDLMKCPYDLSVLKGRGNDDHAAWAEKFIIQNQMNWSLYYALRAQTTDDYESRQKSKFHFNEFVRFIEIDEKFARMQFIQPSIK